MDWFDIHWVGLTAENLQKARVTVLLLAVVLLASVVLRRVLHAAAHDRFSPVNFWSRQLIGLAASAAVVLGVLSIWVDRPESLTAVLGMVTAGLAFALQRVITSMAGYFIILRGKIFTVGDRISMGGVRGDVTDVAFFQTTIMEMGQPKDEGSNIWVRGRQFTGRIVTVANSVIFDSPIYNYTKDFPLMWEEISIVASFDTDRDRMESIALAAARAHADPSSMLDARVLDHIKDSYDVSPEALEPRVYFRIEREGIEATLRFIVLAHHDRDAKDAVTRDMLAQFAAQGIRLGTKAA